MIRPDACSRRWEAEAIEDGRLDGPERASFEKHLVSCAICQREVLDLAEVRAKMQDAPQFASTPLERRRLRASLLRRAHDQMVDPGGQRRWRSQYWAPVVVIAVAAALLVGQMWRKQLIVSGSGAPPAFEVTGLDHADWTTETSGATTRVVLASGSASFHVQRTRDQQRFLLELPDGEIEVRGTRFIVELAERTTRHVEVSEGLVVLRLRGDSERQLAPGESWDRPETSLQTPVTAPSSNPTAQPSGERARAAASGADRRPIASSRRDLPLASDQDTPSARDPFRAGVEALRAGDFIRADALLGQFLERSPRDPRVEDAWFLRAVGRSRSGDAEGAADLAKEYLRRFPNGLRRPEATRIAAGQ